MKALISPIEPVLDGYRIVQVEESEFPVASPFFWIECLPGVAADYFYYDPVSKIILEVPVVSPAVAPDQPVVTGTDIL